MCRSSDQLCRAFRTSYYRLHISKNIDSMCMSHTLWPSVAILVHQTPADEWVVHECFEHSHQGLLVVTKDLHANLASVAETALNAADLYPRSVQQCSSQYNLETAHLHRMCQHPCQSERYSLRELLTRHSNLEAIAEVDVHDLACLLMQHQV